LADRYDPLPGIAGLPGFLWRKLGRPGRVFVVVLAVAGVAAIVASIPGVSERKRDNELRDRREEAAERRDRLARQRELVRPRRAAGIRTLGALESAIAADVARRDGRRPRRVECRRIAGGARQKLSCLAVTSEAGSVRGSRGVTLGFPYRAVADLRSGRAVFCRAIGRPGEGAYRKGTSVPLPAACF